MTSAPTVTPATRYRRRRSWSQPKSTASISALPIAGKYQKRSARTVGSTTGMLEWGK